MKILDACCGSKMFWVDREHKETVYMDNRMENTTLCDGRKCRAIGCHSTCAAYIKYSLSRKEELETRNIRHCVHGYIKTNNNRIKRSKGKY